MTLREGRQFGFTIARRLRSLDPVGEHEEFVRLGSDVLYGDPAPVHAIFLVAFARQMAVPSIARVMHRGGGGDMMRDSARRNDETLAILGEIVTRGHSSPEGRAAIALMERIHSRFAITDEDERYTLSSFVFEPDRIAARLGFAKSGANRRALWHFWRSVGEQMRLADLPATAEEFLEWARDYEREHWRYTEGGRAVVETMFDDWTTRWFPPRTRPLGRQVLLALMGGKLRSTLRLEPPRRIVEAGLPPAIAAYVLSTLARPLRTDRSWGDYYASRLGPARDFERAIAWEPAVSPQHGNEAV